MLLERLSEYADRLDLPPPMYQPVAVRYAIQLDQTGAFQGLIDRASPEQKRGPTILAPSRKRTVKIAPLLLADNAEYTLGVPREGSKPERVAQQRAIYVDVMRACAARTGEASVAAVVAFLETLDRAAPPLPAGFDPTANITFEVDGILPMDLSTVRAFWADWASAADDDAPVMQCLVCGEMRPCVERLAIPIKGIPGGNPTGMALVAANADAFLSYGLKASLIAPTCETCGLRFGNALNALLGDDRTHLRVGTVAYVFWTRAESPFSVATLLSRADPADVKGFLSAPWRARPEAARLAAEAFYAATLSASVARVVVRDWIETTLGDAQGHLERYFRLQRLVGGDGESRWFALWHLLRATVNSKSKSEEPAAQVGQALLHLALRGGPLPRWLLFQAVRRTRAEQQVMPAHAALIKMVLLSEEERKGEDDMAELDRAERNPAYLCGRLLAELEAVQRAALGTTNTTIVDRYFGTASSAPASVFGRLVRGAQPHLAKLRHEREGAYRRLDAHLAEILEGLPEFPRTLTLVDQGRFALGYYHQKAADSRAARAAAEAKRQAGQADQAGSEVDQRP